ncbi:hypothetical protein B0J17DRAFT_628818 [Rhizoctonia solani]|nr:hypothetical protein B0J17DRAFT_628818 [Rhizoctonia solani]
MHDPAGYTIAKMILVLSIHSNFRYGANQFTQWVLAKKVSKARRCGTFLRLRPGPVGVWVYSPYRIHKSHNVQLTGHNCATLFTVWNHTKVDTGPFRMCAQPVVEDKGFTPPNTLYKRSIIPSPHIRFANGITESGGYIAEMHVRAALSILEGQDVN